MLANRRIRRATSPRHESPLILTADRPHRMQHSVDVTTRPELGLVPLILRVSWAIADPSSRFWTSPPGRSTDRCGDSRAGPASLPGPSSPVRSVDLRRQRPERLILFSDDADRSRGIGELEVDVGQLLGLVGRRQVCGRVGHGFFFRGSRQDVMDQPGYLLSFTGAGPGNKGSDPCPMPPPDPPRRAHVASDYMDPGYNTGQRDERQPDPSGPARAYSAPSRLGEGTNHTIRRSTSGVRRQHAPGRPASRRFILATLRALPS